MRRKALRNPNPSSAGTAALSLQLLPSPSPLALLTAQGRALSSTTRRAVRFPTKRVHKAPWRRHLTFMLPILPLSARLPLTSVKSSGFKSHTKALHMNQATSLLCPSVHCQWGPLWREISSPPGSGLHPVLVCGLRSNLDEGPESLLVIPLDSAELRGVRGWL